MMSTAGTASYPEEGSRPASVGGGLGERRPGNGPTAPTRGWDMTVQEQDMMARFRRDYLELLDGRVEKIRRLIASAQTEPAHVALLSLESSSAMLGLRDLAGSVRRLRSALPQDSEDVLSQLFAEVADQAARAHRQLDGV